MLSANTLKTTQHAFRDGSMPYPDDTRQPFSSYDTDVLDTYSDTFKAGRSILKRKQIRPDLHERQGNLPIP
jgi:hypothetical protein